MVEYRRKKLSLIINRLLALQHVKGEDIWEEYVKLLSMSVDADAFAVLSVQPGDGIGRILGGRGLRTQRVRWPDPLELPLLSEYAARSFDLPSDACDGTFIGDPFLKNEKARSMLLKGAGCEKKCLLAAAFRREDRAFKSSERERFAAVSGVISLLCGYGLPGAHHASQGARDQLTGLGLFPEFHKALAKELSRARRDGRSLTMGIMAIDPREKVYREDVLLDVVRIMRERFRDFDTLVRYGPQELAFILPGLGNSLAVKVLDRIVGDVLSSLGGGEVAPVIYLGLSGYPDEGTTDERLIELAEAAMNRAREESSPGVHRWEE